jgi:hypothetical protein
MSCGCLVCCTFLSVVYQGAALVAFLFVGLGMVAYFCSAPSL